MRLESKKYLYDIARAADLIRRFTKGKAFADFEGDEMMRSAVERQFEIIGEALNKLARGWWPTRKSASCASACSYPFVARLRDTADSMRFLVKALSIRGSPLSCS